MCKKVHKLTNLFVSLHFVSLLELSNTPTGIQGGAGGGRIPPLEAENDPCPTPLGTKSPLKICKSLRFSSILADLSTPFPKCRNKSLGISGSRAG